MKAIAAYGFGGAFALGARQAGFELEGVLEGKGAFGTPVITHNPHLYGYPWTHAGAPAEWPCPERGAVELLIGNPPCAGFSGINTSKGKAGRGTESTINQCMWDFFAYAARLQPEIVIMESVQQAYTKGSNLMRQLVGMLNFALQESAFNPRGVPPYHLTHVLQNNLSCHGSTNRPRYFLVASRVPFGVIIPVIERVPTWIDVVQNLASLPLKWGPQEVAPDFIGYANRFHTPSRTTDGHVMQDNAHMRRMMSLLHGGDLVWNAGDTDLMMLKRYWGTYATLPECWDYLSFVRGGDGQRIPKSELLVKNEFTRPGFSSTMAWYPDKPGRVLTGAGPGQFFNCVAQRMPTYRECARVMGFPDSLMIEPLKDYPGMYSWWGKQTSVDPARWICEAARNSLAAAGSRHPGYVGEVDEHGDRVINVSRIWKDAWLRQQREVLTA